VASLLEIGRPYKSKGVSTKRSILIVIVTGEELGLLGSAFFAANPTVPNHPLSPILTPTCNFILPLLSLFHSAQNTPA
jgi:Zn-dependent M28 family amino/carboxypeptidase